MVSSRPHGISEAEFAELCDEIYAREERLCQSEAYAKLFSELAGRVAQTFKITYMRGQPALDLIDKINYFIEEGVRAWITQKNEQGFNFEPRQFFWTVKFGSHASDVLVDHFPEVLKQLGTGTSSLKFFKPSPELLLELITNLKKEKETNQ